MVDLDVGAAWRMAALYLFLVLYQFASLYMLKELLSTTFGYLHISYDPQRGGTYFLVCVLTPLAVLPAGTRLETAGQLMFPVLTALIMQTTPLYLVSELRGPSFWSIYGCIFFSMVLLAGATRVTIHGFQHPLPPRKYKILLWLLAAFFIVFLVGGATQNFHIVSFAEIYNFRDSEAYADLSFIIRVVCMYVFSLGGLFAGIGLLRRKNWLVAAALAGYVFCFGVSQYKSAIMGPAWLIYVYLAGRYFCKGSTLRYYAALTAPFFVGVILLLLFPDARSFGNNLPVFAYFTYVNFRFYGTSNEAVGIYYDFFQHHPTTLWSHITGINFFLHYPYGSQQIAEVLDKQYGLGNFNAGFLATDSIAAFGYEAIPIVSVAMALLYVVMNSTSRGIDKTVLMAMMVMPALMFNERAFATSLLTGGIIFFIMYLAFMPEAWRTRAALRP
jgi:hypothetical protein